MDDATTEYGLLEFGPLEQLTKRGRQGMGGPKSAAGKKSSSQNSRKHGCRSKEKFVPGEKRADYEALWAEWLGEYEPESEGELAHLERIVDAAWRLRRAERAFTKTERALHQETKDAAQWPAELLARLQVMQRYRTGAENSLHKEVRLLEMLKARRGAEQRAHERSVAEYERKQPEVMAEVRAWEAEKKAAAEAGRSRAEVLFCGQRAAAKRGEAVRLEQWAEVRVVAGRTVTEVWPSHAELLAQGQAVLPPPTVVERWLSFPEGVPAEYAWVGARGDEAGARGVAGVQRLTPDAWLEVREREEAAGDEHLLPAPLLRRSREPEMCECPRCVMSAEIFRRALRGESFPGWERRT